MKKLLKTKEQIKKYFKSKLWYLRFCYYFEKKHNIAFLKYLNNLDEKNFQSIFLYSFPFEETEEGIKYWSKVSIRYSDWFFETDKKKRYVNI